MPIYVYASVRGDDKIVKFEMDPASGKLGHRDDMKTNSGPACMTTNPAGNAVFVVMRGHDEIGIGGDGVPRPEFALESFTIDKSNGRFKPISRVGVGGEGAYLKVDARGRFLLSAYFAVGHVAVHPIDANNALGAAIEWRETNTGAHSISIERSNRFVYVPHIADRPPEGQPGVMRTIAAIRKPPVNAIFIYKFDQDTGRLTRHEEQPWITPSGPLGPRHQCFHPTLPILYVVNEQDPSVTVYPIDERNGKLTRGANCPTEPAGFSGRHAPSEICIHPSGKFLFVSNRGHNSIATIAIAKDGALSPGTFAATDLNPRSFTLDPTGHFLYCAAVDAGTLAGYRIDQTTGALELIEKHQVGNKPMWVLARTV